MKYLKYTILIIFLCFSFKSVAQEEGREDKLDIGGAVRFNLASEFYETNPKTTDTYFTFDTWRINVDARKAGIDLSFEYRFYPTFGTHFIHHGYFGYAFNDDLYMKLGVFQKPFGITKYASHSWWFQIPYYVGLEDDYDMGIGFDWQVADNLAFNFAYFRQAEPEGPKFEGVTTFGNAGPGRYSYDIIPGVGGIWDENSLEEVDASVRELNMLNLQAVVDVSESVEIGASAQINGIYNSVLDESETAIALAGHLLSNFGDGFNFKGEYIYYNYNAKSDDGRELSVLQMGAYGSPYFVATEATIFVAGLAYTIDTDWGPISSIQPYLDYSYVNKMNDDFSTTRMMVPGFLITAGNVYTYVDYAMGKNQPWLTNNFGEGLGVGSDEEWNARFNINFGYYF